MTHDLWRWPAHELAPAFAAGTLRPSEVLASLLDRLGDDPFNAFAHLSRTVAAEAAASDARWAEGSPLSPFDGLPISVKDNLEVAGMPCAWGSRVFADHVPVRDELPVARLRAQGWLILGKTNVSEFTLGLGNVSTPLHGTTRNPHDSRLTTGASTGGGAAAVASGVGPLTLGTDGGGSIRWPAGYCGLVGLKPTVGRIPRLGGLPVILHDFEVVAPLGRTARDVDLLLTALEEPDPRDRRSFGPADPAARPLPARPLRIRYVRKFGTHHVEPEILRSVDRAAENLAELGHHVEEGAAPFDFGAFDRHWPVIGRSGLAWVLRERPGRRDLVGEIYPPMVEQGEKFTAIDYVAALDAFRGIYAELAEFFETTDLLLTPVAGAMPWPADRLAPPYQRVFTGVANVAGVPAVSVPGPPDPVGLPVGFQLIGPYGADRGLLSVAAAYEEGFSHR